MESSFRSRLSRLRLQPEADWTRHPSLRLSRVSNDVARGPRHFVNQRDSGSELIVLDISDDCTVGILDIKSTNVGAFAVGKLRDAKHQRLCCDLGGEAFHDSAIWRLAGGAPWNYEAQRVCSRAAGGRL